jgi:uncharacterized protein (TIGR01244 family)
VSLELQGEGIMNYVRPITPKITVADQPTEADLESFKAQGYVGVVNLRNQGEPDQPLSPTAEGEKAQALGLEYLHVGIGAAPLSETGVSAVCAFLDRHAEDQVLVHCRRGGRAVAMVLLHRALKEKWGPGEAVDKGKSVGMEVEGGLKMLVEQYLQEHAHAG